MKTEKIKSFDYRWLLLILILIFVGGLLIFELIFGRFRLEIFNLYSFWGQSKLFDDLELLLCGIESMRNGLDPYPILCYEGAAPYNYPSTWRIFSWIPFFNLENRLFIGWTMVVSFFILFFRYIRNLNFFQCLCYICFLFSPASLMLFCMGNSDLIVMIILLLGLVLLPQRFLSITISLATLLKLFPIGGIFAILNSPEKNKKYFLLGLIIIVIPFLCYLILGWHELFLIKQNTPTEMVNFSYGLGRIRYNLSSKILKSTNIFFDIIFYLVFFLAFFIFFKTTYQKFKSLSITGDRIGNGFLVGIGIFIFSYFFQINYEYRLFFLILTLPQLFRWLKGGNKFIYAALFGSVIMLWDQSLTLFWNSFLETRTAVYYLFLRSLRDIIALSMIYFYGTVLLLYLINNHIFFMRSKINII